MQNLTIVFDLDGTLIDTAPDLIRATNHVLATKDLPALDADLLRPNISFGARSMIETGLKIHGMDYSERLLNELFEEFLAFYTDNIAIDSRPFDGIVPLLEYYRASGTRLAVCTNKREDMTITLLKALKLFDQFDAIAGRDTFDVFKPHPAHLTQTIDLAGGSAARAIMVGDSQTDIKTAEAATIPVIGVTFGYSDPPMEQLNPTRMIGSYSQFEQTVTNLLNSDIFTTA